MSETKKKVLVIDDEENIVKLIESRLKANEYDVMTAANGKEGLEQLEKESPNLIILDVMMPVMDGFEFFKIIKKDPNKSKIPVLVLTARGGMRDTFEALDADGFLPKPFEAEQLLIEIEGIFKKRVLVLSDDENFTDKISNVIAGKGLVVEVAEQEDEMLKKGATEKFHLVLAYLGSIKKEPKDFLMLTRMMRNRKAKTIIYSDVKATGTDSTVTIDEIKTKWERAGVGLFFDQLVSRENIAEIVERFVE